MFRLQSIGKKGYGFFVWGAIVLMGIWGVYNFLPDKVPVVEDTIMSGVSFGIQAIGNIGGLNRTNETNELLSRKEVIYIESPSDSSKTCRCEC